MSYSREDSAFALGLAADLKAKGANVWLDQLDIRPGRQWDREVEQALTTCSQMLVILSPAAIDSNNVMDEVAFALEERKAVIPVLHRDCRVPFRLRRVQYIDFRSDYERGVNSLLSALATDDQTPPSAGAAIGAPLDHLVGKEPAMAGHQAAEADVKAEQERPEIEWAEAERKAQRDRVLREQAESERTAEQDRVQREKDEAERKAEQERVQREKAEAERKAEQERVQRERAEAERKAEQERVRREKDEAERKAEQERIQRENAEAERKAEQDRIQRDKAEAEGKAQRDRIQRESAEAEWKAQRDQVQREKAEAELRAGLVVQYEATEVEKSELERIERERVEAERAAELDRNWSALSQKWADDAKEGRSRRILIAGIALVVLVLIVVVLMSLDANG